MKSMGGPGPTFRQVISVGSTALAVATLQDLQKTFEMNFHMFMWRVCCVFAVMTQATSVITAALFLLKRSLSGSSALFGYGLWWPPTSTPPCSCS